MTTQVQWRRGTTAEHATFTGALAEITVDTDKNTAVVHDGATPGGFALARAGEAMYPIEVADLTNGGLNNLTEYTLTHALQSGYIYLLGLYNVSATASWLAYVRVRNVGGTWRGTNEYRQSGDTTTNTGAASVLNNGVYPYYYASIASFPASTHADALLHIVGAGDAGRLTTFFGQSSAYGTGLTNTSRVSAVMDVAQEAHDRVRVLTTGGTFDSGKAMLWRLLEPT